MAIKHLIFAFSLNAMAQFPAPATYPDFSSFVASADRLSNILSNLTEKIPDILLTINKMADTLNTTQSRVPEITNASNRMSDTLRSIALQLPDIVDKIDQTNDNVAQFTGSINNIVNTVLTPGYIIGTIAGVVAISLAFGATFIGGRYAINRYCIDQTQVPPGRDEVPIVNTNELPGSPS